MTVPTKLAVFFISYCLILPVLKAQSAENSISVNLSVEVDEVVSISMENNTLSVQSNSTNSFSVLVFDETSHNTSYFSARSDMLMETGKTYTVIPAL
ncbi:MAG: hypothetical protein WAV73_01735 [Candidatus Moraniibacteriota bacterium]